MQYQRMEITNRKSNIITRVPLLTTLTLLTSLTVSPAFAADTGIYKTIGADGSIVFTDKPQNTTSIAATSKSEPSLAKSQPAPNTNIRSGEFSSDTLGGLQNRNINITAVKITSPTNNQTFTDGQDPILIQVAMGPDTSLPEGHTALVRMNGNKVANGSNMEASVPAPGQGTHIFDVQIMNSNGKILAQSAAIKVHVN